MGVRVSRAVGWWIVPLLSVAGLAATSADLRLVDAVEQGNTAAVRSLLKEHADVNAPRGDGATALVWAVHRDDLETAELLLRAGANVNAATDYGVTPLSLACHNGSAVMVEKLLKAGANPNAAQVTGETPLMTCSRAGSVEAVKLLLAHKADVNAKETERGQTALMWAAAEQHPEVVRELAGHGADVHARSKVLGVFEPMISVWYSKDSYVPKSTGGFTPLMFAARAGDLESAGILLAAGANGNDATAEDGSALVVASASGHEDLALFLLESGADPNAKDAYGTTPLHWSLQEGIQALSGAGDSPTDSFWLHPNMPRLMKALLAHGADPNARILKDHLPYDNHSYARSLGNNLPQIYLVGTTPFVLAAATGDVNTMRFLVESRGDPKLATAEGTTALMVAAGVGRERGQLTEEQRKNYIDAAKMALDLGADINAANAHGRTALHGAVTLGDTAMIQFLAEKGANLEAKDMYKETPMSIAMGDPEGLIWRQVSGDRFDYRFRQPRGGPDKKAVELLLKLGATPWSGKVFDRSSY